MLIIASIALFFSPIPRQDSLGFITILIGILIVLIFSKVTPRIKYILIIAFALRVILILIHVYVIPLPETSTGSDMIYFEESGWRLAQNGIFWLFGHFKSGAYFYTWVIGFIYALFGRSAFMIQVLNAILGTIVVWAVYSISVFIWGGKQS